MTDRGQLDDTTVALWDRLFAVNARAPFLLMQASVRPMRREGTAGSIVNSITRSSHGGQQLLTAYSASKGALAVLTNTDRKSVVGGKRAAVRVDQGGVSNRTKQKEGE